MDAPSNDFNGFGDGFEGFPKRLPEDCVEYSLFIIDSKLKAQKELLARLEVVRKEALKLTDSLLKEYIWQRDGFKVEVESGKGAPSLSIVSIICADLKVGLMHLHGLTNYGDSVEDEWLIVYILKELSNKFPELWIQVADTDGEFLLIEAANALPRWLNPEIAENRVSKYLVLSCLTIIANMIKRSGFMAISSASSLSVQPLLLHPKRRPQYPDLSPSMKPTRPFPRIPAFSYTRHSLKQKHSTDSETTLLKLQLLYTMQLSLFLGN